MLLAEMKGQEIRLVVLSAKTGKLDWSQQLCVVEQSILHGPERRAGGAAPSFADGVLVCPTSAGAIVAVDATTRNLLWGYQYPRSPADEHQPSQRHADGHVSDRPRIGDRWADSTITLADGKVVATPIESEYFYVPQPDQRRRPVEGRTRQQSVRGRRPRRQRDRRRPQPGHRLSLGRRRAGLDLLGRPPPTPPDGAMPSGRGFLSGHDYFLPLSSAEVIQIDLAQGKIVSRARSRWAKFLAT